MAVNDIYQISINGTLQLADWTVIPHLQITAEQPGVTDIEALISAAILGSNIPTEWQNRSTQGTFWNVLGVYRVAPTRGFPRLFGTGGIEGNIADNPLPCNCGTRHMWYGNSSDKEKRGRHNFPGVPELNQIEGLLEEAQIALEQTFADTFLPTLVDTMWAAEWGVFSRKLGTLEQLQRVSIHPSLRKLRNRTPEQAT